MLAASDYWNLLDYSVGVELDILYYYSEDIPAMSTDEVLDGLYSNFINNTSPAERKMAHDLLEDFRNADEKLVGIALERKKHVASLICKWAYDSLSHGI